MNDEVEAYNVTQACVDLARLLGREITDEERALLITLWNVAHEAGYDFGFLEASCK